MSRFKYDKSTKN